MACKRFSLQNVLVAVIFMNFIHHSLSVSLRRLAGGSVDAELIHSEKVSCTMENVRDPVKNINPIEEILLQEENLQTWRDIRTIEEVVKQNTEGSIFQRRVKYYTDAILNDCPFQNTPNSPTKSTATQVDLDKMVPKEALVYHLLQIIKGHSNPTEHTKLDVLGGKILTTFNFVPEMNRKKDKNEARRQLLPFLNFALSKIGWHLLLENFQKSRPLEHGLNYLPQTYDILKGFKKTGRDQLKYGAYYRDYMHIFTVFDILVFDGLQNRNMLFNLYEIKSKPMKERKLVDDHIGSPNDIHRYLINRTPWDGKVWTPVHFYEDPLKTLDPNSSQFSKEIYECWLMFGENDHKILTQLGSILEEDTFGDFKVPFIIKEMENLDFFEAVKDRNKLTYPLVLNYMFQAIDLISTLDEDEPEILSILCEIFTNSLKLIEKKSNFNECKGIVSNSVMFFLFIRRTGNVLKHVLERNFPNTPLRRKLTTVESMGYYWDLTKFKSTHCSKDQTTRWKWLDFELGKVYSDHLLAAEKLETLYHELHVHLQSKEVLYSKTPMILRTTPRWKESRVLGSGSQKDQNLESFGILSLNSKKFPFGQGVLNDESKSFKRIAFDQLKELYASGNLNDIFKIRKKRQRKRVLLSLMNKGVGKKAKKRIDSHMSSQKKTQLSEKSAFNTDRFSPIVWPKKSRTRISDGSLKGKRELSSSQNLSRTESFKTNRSKIESRNTDQLFTCSDNHLHSNMDTNLSGTTLNAGTHLFSPEFVQDNTEKTFQFGFSPPKRKSTMDTNFDQENFFDRGWPKKPRRKITCTLSSQGLPKSQSSFDLHNPGLNIATCSNTLTLEQDSNSSEFISHQAHCSNCKALKEICTKKGHMFDLNEVPGQSDVEQDPTEQGIIHCTPKGPQCMNRKYHYIPDLNSSTDITE
ncbi:hypothetical protein DFH28DRAFT_170002 [Melampsora americana]|nr:hypothetical protein DFH28DRAFT_170002 [Melampsora americana]